VRSSFLKNYPDPKKCVRSMAFGGRKRRMETVLNYRGKSVSREDVDFIRSLIAQNPGDSRRKPSVKLCQAWNWVQANGEPRDMVCRSLMLELERAGFIELPPKKSNPPNPLAVRRKPEPALIDQSPIEGTLRRLPGPVILQVRRGPFEKLFGGLIEQHHYLGYCQPVGEHLKYLVTMDDRPIACFSWSSAPRHIGCRDRFIGWSPQIRRKNIHLIAYNSRFLLLPWVRIPHLASHLLGKIARRLSRDWQELYGHPIYLLETFVDTERFKGTCYRASNWIHLGQTTGRGIKDKTHKPNRSIKDVWGFCLDAKFREKLCR
jgi:Druantia protein DruA